MRCELAYVEIYCLDSCNQQYLQFFTYFLFSRSLSSFQFDRITTDDESLLRSLMKPTLVNMTFPRWDTLSRNACSSISLERARGLRRVCAVELSSQLQLIPCE